jgi:hydroxymethylbilane synthase
MTTLRAGTRGSRLALTQTRWVCERLRAAHASLQIEEIIIKTQGDVAVDKPFDASWPVGSFVNALEAALLAGEIDFAVHSYKDLPSQSPQGLVIAAVPGREAVEDVLVVREPVDLDRLPDGFRIGTSSPRRTAQLRRLGDVVIVPIRGNVPTRLEKIKGDDLDGVVLAAAGLRRLGLRPEHVIDLPPDRFVPSPAQGALAVQARAGDEAAKLIAVLDDEEARRAVTAERSFLAAVEAGCQTPLGALATVSGDRIELRAQLFSDDGERLVEGVEEGDDPQQVGSRLAGRLLAELQG